MYDVAVVGAGPIGSYTAYQLADRGFDVLLLEEDAAVGEDVICTGVIGTEAFERFDLPLDSILTKIREFTFVSPSGIRLEYIHPDEFVYVVDRERFDKGIFQLAIHRGVEAKLGQKVQEIREDGKTVILKSGGNRYRSRTVVIATGINSAHCPACPSSQIDTGKERGIMRCGADYELQHSAGIGGVKNFILGAQTIMPVSTSDSTVEIHIGQKIAPGSFAWVVPIGYGKARVGLLTEKKSKYWLRQFIENRLGYKILDTDRIREKPIAFGTIEKSVNSRVLVVGEAAGQVKTTTGGGIFYGLLGSEIAADILTKALRGNIDCLVEYEQRWRGLLEEEIFMGQHIREIARKVDDETLDRLFNRVKRSRLLTMRIVRRINYEYHSALLSFGLKVLRPLL